MFLGAEQPAWGPEVGRHHRAGSAPAVPLPWNVRSQRRARVRTPPRAAASAQFMDRFLISCSPPSLPPSVCPSRQQDLFSVLKAYTLHRPEEGYCQAQAPIAAVLLMHMPAEVQRPWPYFLHLTILMLIDYDGGYQFRNRREQTL